jgi:hypothetical protein
MALPRRQRLTQYGSHVNVGAVDASRWSQAHASASCRPEWRTFLGDYSSKFLNSNYLREAQREAGWLGYESASEEAVLAGEERLGAVPVDLT